MSGEFDLDSSYLSLDLLKLFVTTNSDALASDDTLITFEKHQDSTDDSKTAVVKNKSCFEITSIENQTGQDIKSKYRIFMNVIDEFNKDRWNCVDLKTPKINIAETSQDRYDIEFYNEKIGLIWKFSDTQNTNDEGVKLVRREFKQMPEKRHNRFTVRSSVQMPDSRDGSSDQLEFAKPLTVTTTSNNPYKDSRANLSSTLPETLPLNCVDTIIIDRDQSPPLPNCRVPRRLSTSQQTLTSEINDPFFCNNYAPLSPHFPTNVNNLLDRVSRSQVNTINVLNNEVRALTDHIVEMNSLIELLRGENEKLTRKALMMHSQLSPTSEPHFRPKVGLISAIQTIKIDANNQILVPMELVPGRKRLVNLTKSLTLEELEFVLSFKK